MDPEQIRATFLDKFRQVVNERVARLTDLFGKILKAPEDKEPSTELERELHTLKGESRMMGFAEAGRILHAVEDRIKAYRDHGFAQLDAFEDMFHESLDTVSEIALRGAQPDVDALCRRIEIHPAGAAVGGATSEAERSVPAVEEPPTARAQPAATATDKPEQPGPKTYRLSNLVRVSGQTLDRLSDMVGDLFSSYLRMNELSKAMDGLWHDMRTLAIELNRNAPRSSLTALGTSSIPERVQDMGRRVAQFRRGYLERTSSMASVLDQLLDHVAEIRLLPVSDLFNLYRTAARDIARQTGKRLKVRLEGESTPVDRSILDALGDIMLHLIRNAIDHGIEDPETRQAAGKSKSGELFLRARTVNDRIQIDVQDDGRGVDVERIKRAAVAKGLISQAEAEELQDDGVVELIFLPGLSSAAAATDISGRGVGMDVVRSKLQDLGGSIQVQSHAGKGTRFMLELPTSIAIARVLLFRVGEQTFAILATFIRRVDRIDPASLITTSTGQALVVDGQTVGAVRADELFRIVRQPTGSKKQPVVVVEHGGRILTLLVDELMGERELTIKPFSPYLSSIRTVSGAATLEDGTLILVLHAGELASAGSRVRRGFTPTAQAVDQQPRRVLLVEDSLITRELERSVLVSFGLQVEEAGDGIEALELVASQEFDIIVSDVEMPRLDGFELTRRLKRDDRWSHIPVILITTLGSDQDRRRGMEAGADGYIVKSEFGSQSFIEMVRRFLP